MAAASVSFVGFGFKVTRELAATTVDCSTLVSQSHWIGAAVQVPFIAENQRLSATARAIEFEDLMVGDVLVAYESSGHSPLRRHNHVVLYLGEDSRGEPWCIESKEPHGVCFTPLADALHGGGVRRFCPNPHSAFESGAWNALVRAVPKLSRLGARLTSKYGGESRHSGIDVYVIPFGDVPVLAPIDGIIVDLSQCQGGPKVVTISDRAGESFHVLGPIAGTTVCEGDRVDTGRPLGLLTSAHMRCNVTTLFGRSHRRLHWELWDSSPIPSPAPTVTTRSSASQALAVVPSLRARNPAYCLKSGESASPVDAENLTRWTP